MGLRRIFDHAHAHPETDHGQAIRPLPATGLAPRPTLRLTIAVVLVAALVALGAGATASPASASARHPRLILTPSSIRAIRSRISHGRQPQAAAWRAFRTRLSSAMSSSTNVYVGPYRGNDSNAARSAFDRLGRAGSNARNLGIGYVLTGKRTYAAKARALLVAWAKANHPTTVSDWNTKDTGQLQSYGDFSFAYAYDLTYDAGVYSASDRTAIRSWFRRSVNALQTCLRPFLTDYFFTHPDRSSMKGTYEWDSSLHYSKYDALIVGSDFPMLMNAASLAMAYDVGYTKIVRKIMSSSKNPVNITKIVRSALTPRNEGDGAGTKPVPQEKIYKSWSSRGGMFDYMTYNTRTVNVLVDMAGHLGWGSNKLRVARTKLRRSWTYMARFFPPNARRNFNPTDRISLTACLPRFTLAWHDFGLKRFSSIVKSGKRATYNEPQLLGPVTLTHSIVHK